MEERKVDRRGRFRWRYRIYEVADAARLAGQAIQVLRLENGSSVYFYQNEKLEARLCDERKEIPPIKRASSRLRRSRGKSAWMKGFDLSYAPSIWSLLRGGR
jgi:hypothetical protein